MSRIERVSYRSGFVKRLRESRHLPAITFEAADLPEGVVSLVCREREQVSRRTVTLDSQYPDYGGHPTDYWLANAGRKLD